eukprot:scaffold73759_cov28-Prasinocladus_malaysianus.AAC.2
MYRPRVLPRLPGGPTHGAGPPSWATAPRRSDSPSGSPAACADDSPACRKDSVVYAFVAF